MEVAEKAHFSSIYSGTRFNEHSWNQEKVAQLIELRD